MFHTQIIDKELYLYYNGILVFKKWLRTNQSILFCEYSLNRRFHEK